MSTQPILLFFYWQMHTQVIVLLEIEQLLVAKLAIL